MCKWTGTNVTESMPFQPLPSTSSLVFLFCKQTDFFLQWSGWWQLWPDRLELGEKAVFRWLFRTLSFYTKWAWARCSQVATSDPCASSKCWESLGLHSENILLCMALVAWWYTLESNWNEITSRQKSATPKCSFLNLFNPFRSTNSCCLPLFLS